MEFIRALEQTWAHPQMRHAMLVHWPIVLSIVSSLLAVAMAFNRGKNAQLRWITLLACVGLAIAGYMTEQSGSRAEDAASIQSPEAQANLNEHEELGEKVPFLGAICTAVIALAFVRKPAIRVAATCLGVVACGGTSLWIANTAHYGGLLVYRYGVGTPATASSSNPDTAPALEASSDPKIAFFREHIKPILSSRCMTCHNSARVASGRSGKLDQTTRDTLLAGGRSGPAVVPGKPEDSLLIKRVRGEVPDSDTMPPPPKDPLTPEQIAAIEQWIRDGAVWE